VNTAPIKRSRTKIKESLDSVDRGLTCSFDLR
jgi:hypothetical protein